MDDLSLDVKGLEELTASLERLSKKYPDAAGELLMKNARELRKDVVKEVKKATKPTNDDKKYHLSKAGSYKISGIIGFGSEQRVEISARAKHFHLVEHGHRIIVPPFHGIKGKKGVRVRNENAGQNLGSVRGKKMMDIAVKRSNINMPKTVSNMVDELLKKEGLI